MHFARILLIVCCSLSAVSCRGVHSVRPIPAEKDSVIDTRLIGMWMPTKSKKRDPENDAASMRIPWVMVISQSPHSKTTMEHFSILIPQKIEEESESENASQKNRLGKQAAKDDLLQYPFHGKIYIHHDKINTISLEFCSAENPKKEKRYSDEGYEVDRYEVKDENTLLLYALNFDHLKKAVETKQLNGSLEDSFKQSEKSGLIEPKSYKVKENSDSNQGTAIVSKEKNKKREVVSVILDDDPKKIIRYLEAHPEAFEKNPSVYKRIDYGFPKEMDRKTVPINPSATNLSPSEKNKAITPASLWNWFSALFLGTGAGVLFTMIAVLVVRKSKTTRSA